MKLVKACCSATIAAGTLGSPSVAPQRYYDVIEQADKFPQTAAPRLKGCFEILFLCHKSLRSDANPYGHNMIFWVFRQQYDRLYIPGNGLEKWSAVEMALLVDTIASDGGGSDGEGDE